MVTSSQLNAESSVLSLFGNDQYRTYNVEIARKIGVEEAIVLNDLIDEYRYRLKKGQLTELKGLIGGWFFYSATRCEERTAITKKPLMRILKSLRQKNLITTVKKGMPAVNYYQINWEVVSALLEVPNETTSSPKRDHKKSQTGPQPHIIYTNTKNEPKNTTRNSVALSEKAFGLADFLWTKMKENNPKTKDRTEQERSKWAAEIDRMNRIDKYTWKEIEELITFSQEDEFWQANILSAAKLRKQAAQLMLKQKKKRTVTGESAKEKVDRLKVNREAAMIWKSVNEVPDHRMKIEEDYCEIKVYDEWVRISFYEYGFEEQIRNAFKKAGL